MESKLINLNLQRGLPSLYKVDGLTVSFAHDQEVNIGDTISTQNKFLIVKEIIERRAAAGEWIGERPQFFKVLCELPPPEVATLKSFI